MISRLLKSILLPISAIAALCISCGPTLDEGTDARIRVTPPHTITFSRVAVGSSRTLPMVVTSVGRDQLKVQKIVWEGSEAVTLSTENAAIPQSLAPLASLAVSVNFAPSETAPAPTGKIHVYTNDTTEPVYTIDVTAQQLAPHIHVSPSAEEKLIFGQTDSGSTTTKTVTVTNSGDLALTVSEIKLSASSAFSYQLTNADSLPVILAPNAGSALTLTVSFTPSAAGKDEGTAVFLSNDPETPKYSLPIIANSDTPCLLMSPSILEFSPPVSVGTVQTKTVQLKSCSSVPLIISDVIKASGPELFTFALHGQNEEIPSGESAKLDISYAPQSEGSASASFTIINNDPLQPNATLNVLASASNNRCPTASARGRLNSASTWAKALDLSPLDTVILDGSLSSDPESSTLQYYWSVKSAPKDSTSQIASDGAEAAFFLDLAGNYELCLNVEDSDGMMSCNSDCVTVSAVPRETIHVQLVWHTPADTIVGDDDGTDLDLHFLKEGGFWGDQTGTASLNNGTDVYFLNKEPVWSSERGTEYPSLDIDDHDGEGPENVNLDGPIPCSWYAVGVHYYEDNAFGPSYATVRIYIDGKMRFEKSNISLPQKAVFKQIAWIFWDGSAARIFETDKACTADDCWINVTPAVPQTFIDSVKASSPACF